MSGMQRTRMAVVVAVVWFAGGAGAAEAPDYSPGFAKLLALGLPSAAGATYVRLSNVPTGMDMMSAYVGRGRRLRLKGNAWLLQESKDGPSRLIAGQSVLEVWERKAWMAQQARAAKQAASAGAPGAAAAAAPVEPGEMDTGGFEHFGGLGGPQVGTWSPADLVQDIAAVLAFLAPPTAPAAPAKAPEDGEDGDSAPEEESALPAQAYAPLFLFAAHCHSFGRTREANQIVQALFARQPDRTQVVSFALRDLARAQYDEHLNAFSRSGDWNAWATALDTLEARFRGVWSSAPAVKRLAGEVRQRATAPPPTLTGEGLTPEDSALAAALAEARGPLASQTLAMARYKPWLLPAEGPTPVGMDPIAKIQARGAAALPLLAALAADPYWTPLVDADSGRRRYQQLEFDAALGTVPAEPAAEAEYQALSRPATRGQIAMALLAAVVPTQGEEDGEHEWMPGAEDPESRKESAQRLAEAARAWQAEVKGKTPLQLADLYLQKGNQSQQQQAIQHLLMSGGEAAYPAIEAAILEAAQGQEGASLMWMAQAYVQQRGPAAKAFVDKLAALAGATPTAAAAPAEGAAGGMFVAGQVDDGSWATQVLPQLQRLVSPQPLSDVLAEVKAGKLPVEEAMQALQSQASTQKPEELLGAFLQLAIDSPDAGTRSGILMSSMSLRYLAMASRHLDESTQQLIAEQLPTLDPTPSAGLWRTLLVDGRSCGDGADYFGVASAPNVQDLAAMAMEALYGKMEDMEQQNMGMAMGLGPRFYELLRARATARLDGKPEAELPPLPDGERVSQERRAAVLAGLRAADPAALPGVTAKLTLDEMIAVGEELQADTTLNPKLLPAANRIVKVTIELPGTDAAAPLATLQGQVLTLEVAKRVQQLCLELAKQGRRVDAELARAPALGGVTLWLRESPPPARQPERAALPGMIGPRAEAMANLFWLQGLCLLITPGPEGGQGTARWRIPPPAEADAVPGAAPAADKGDRLDRADGMDDLADDMLGDQVDDPDQEAEFWETVGRLCQGEGAWSSATLAFRLRSGAEGMGGMY